MSNVNKNCLLVRRLLQIASFSMLFFSSVSFAQANFEGDWYQQFGGIGNDGSHDVVTDTFGNSYVVGSVATALPGETHRGLVDAFIRKYDRFGNVIWTDQFGSTADDRAVSVATNQNYIVVVGITEGSLSGESNAGDRDFFIRTYEPNGTIVMSRQIGSALVDEARTVSVDDNYLYLAGETTGSLAGGTHQGSFDAFVHKYHITGGSLIWAQQFGSTGADRSLGVLATVDGVYVIGTTLAALPGFTNQGNADVFVRKYTSNGVEEWTNQFGTVNFDFAFDIAEQGSSIYIVGDVGGALPGQTEVGNGDAFVRKYDRVDGSIKWTRQFGTTGLDEASTVIADTSGVYVAGYVEGSLSGQPYYGNYDVYIRKYDFLGDHLYTRQFGTSGGEDIYGMSVVDGYLFVTGRTDGSWPGANNAGGDDAYIIRVVEDKDGDSIFDPVDTNVSVSSTDFDDGMTFGTIVTSGDQILVIKDSLNSAEGVTVTADQGGGATRAEIFACGISTFYLDAGDSVMITCGSVIFNVITGSVRIVLYADDGRIAETTVVSGNEVKFVSTNGSVTASPTNFDTVVLTAGNETVILAPGAVVEMPSDLPITVDTMMLSQTAIPIGSNVILHATLTSPIDETSVITGIEYWVNGSVHMAASAADGSYGEESESIAFDLGAFAAAGVYEICVSGTDNMANVSQVSCAMLAVYDPSGGYITGGGQIDSPVGAYNANPTLIGKAYFGFVAEYGEGAQTPTGNTQFRFQAGNLRFKSTSYDWLVVAGARAQFKGYGEIDKLAGYRFMLTAVDGDLLGSGASDDKFRMKIWNDATGTIVYDNQLGASDAANLSTVISNGSIVIHTD